MVLALVVMGRAVTWAEPAGQRDLLTPSGQLRGVTKVRKGDNILTSAFVS